MSRSSAFSSGWVCQRRATGAISYIRDAGSVPDLVSAGPSKILERNTGFEPATSPWQGSYRQEVDPAADACRSPVGRTNGVVGVITTVLPTRRFLPFAGSSVAD